MVSLGFVAAFLADGSVRIQGQRTVPGRWPLRRDRVEIVPTSDWAGSEETGLAVRLLDMAGRGDAEDISDAVLLPPAQVARLTEADALALGLPPAAPLQLSLRGRGLITEADFGVDARWVRANGSDVSARVTGARAQVGGVDYRLPEPLFTLDAAARAINAASGPSARQAAFAVLRRLLDAHLDEVIVEGALRETRIAYASGFSLALAGTDFDPVLFAPRITEAASGGASVDEEADSLLTPAQQAAFARQFRQRAGKAPSYLLPDGVLLFMDPAIARALTVVGDKQRASASERQRFATSPQRTIAETLGEPAERLETLFVETVQYSERVIGIDPWRKPVLPWIKPKPNSWLPERLGLAIGDPPVHIEVPAEQVPAALEAVEAAIAEGRATATVAGSEVPANPATLSALRDLAEIARVDPAEAEQVGPPPSLGAKLFLQVRDNLEDVAYAPLAAAPAAPSAPAAVPASVRTTLKPHQEQGFRWLVEAWRSGRPGVLLADDMGLGKTLQALAFFCWLREQKPRSPILIVAPTGLLANWQAEIERHLAPGALGPVLRAYGTGLKAHREGGGTDIEVGSSRLDTSDWAAAGVVLTTYETMRDYHISMARVGFGVAAFDEAQRLKNPAAQLTRAAKTLRARFSLALTGTPVENRLQDLWSISDVVHPSFLGASKAFEERYGTASLEDLRELNARLTAPMASWPPFMLRRMKSDHVKGLPAKAQREVIVTMPPEQAAAYSQAVRRAVALRASPSRHGMLETLARLRSISLAPDLPRVGDQFAARSARLQAVFQILDGIRARDEKALIFCESLELQPLLAAELRRRFGLARPVPCISGEVLGDTRQRLVDEFQRRPLGFDVMILSPRAGGVGLTITAANHVIHLTRWWNPAVEDQATDRAYRIGQTKEVTVWIPVAEHPDPALKEASFDRRLAALLHRKRSLALGLLAEPESASDAAELFDSVLSTDPAPAEPDAGSPAPSATQQPPPDVALQRPGNVRVVKKSGHSIPWAVFTEVLEGQLVRKIDVVDPFAAASVDNCRAFASFLAGLRERGIEPSSISLVCWDADSLGPSSYDGSASQQRALAAALRHFRVDDLRIIPYFASRRQTRLHDRSITATIDGQGTVLWDLGNGVDGLMHTRGECTIGRWVNPSRGVD